jgi:CRISPR-associated Csx14 family protein
MANVLVASLGESPVVITAMYDLLKEKMNVDKVMVLRPCGDDVLLGYELINEGLLGKCKLDYVQLPFVDANGEGESYLFLRTLFQHLAMYQKNGDTVYLSLAGGRKNMSALMALVVPFSPCVKKLYQVLDADEHKPGHQFKSIGELYDLSEASRKVAIFPPHEKLILVDIPYGEQQRVSSEIYARLFTLTEDELDDLWDEDPALAEATEYYQSRGDDQAMKSVLTVEVTERVQNDYKQMRIHDRPRADRFLICFEQMSDPYRLKSRIHGSGFTRDSLSFHFYKRRRTVERPFYHTEPKSIHLFPEANVEKVIISGLAIEQPDGSYKPTGKEMVKFSLAPTISLATLISSKEVILVVPLGTTPMVATQLYTLLKNEGRIISKVVIIYPGRSREVRNSAELIKDVFDYELLSNIVRDEPVKNLKDITCSSDCELYRQSLEAIIDDVHDHYPDCEIVLSLSGGRKSMAALTMFSAQRKGIRYVYHTLIKDPDLSDTIERQTEVSELQPHKISKQERNDRLFLRAYQSQQDQFVLFRVPVVPSGSES